MPKDLETKTGFLNKVRNVVKNLYGFFSKDLTSYLVMGKTYPNPELISKRNLVVHGKDSKQYR